MNLGRGRQLVGTLIVSLLLPIGEVGLTQTSPNNQQQLSSNPPIQLEAGPLAEAGSLLRQGRSSDAEKSVRRYLSEHQDSAAAHYLLGQILFVEHRTRESLAEYTEAAKHHEPSAFDLKVVALDYVLLSDYADADRWLTQSLERNRQDSEAWYYLGRTKYNENRFQEAIHAFEECLKLDPKNIKAEDNLGLSYQGLGQTQDAASAFRQAIAWQDPVLIKNPQPYVDLGSLLLEQNRTEEGIPYLLQAIGIAPNESRAHEQLGKAYLHQDELQKAQLELEKAVDLSPRNAALHFELGQVYRKEGLTEKAKAEFNRYSSLTETSSSPQVFGPP
jgi:tetratricopeptide (TPR) repeat protein